MIQQKWTEKLPSFLLYLCSFVFVFLSLSFSFLLFFFFLLSLFSFLFHLRLSMTSWSEILVRFITYLRYFCNSWNSFWTENTQSSKKDNRLREKNIEGEDWEKVTSWRFCKIECIFLCFAQKDLLPGKKKCNEVACSALFLLLLFFSLLHGAFLNSVIWGWFQVQKWAIIFSECCLCRIPIQSHTWGKAMLNYNVEDMRNYAEMF